MKQTKIKQVKISFAEIYSILGNTIMDNMTEEQKKEWDKYWDMVLKTIHTRNRKTKAINRLREVIKNLKIKQNYE